MKKIKPAVQLKNLKEEINLLKITINHLKNENIRITQEINDLKVTLQTNKEIEKEYYLQISNHDTTCQKLTNTIEQLSKRIEVFENSNKIDENLLDNEEEIINNISRKNSNQIHFSFGNKSSDVVNNVEGIKINNDDILNEMKKNEEKDKEDEMKKKIRKQEAMKKLNDNYKKFSEEITSLCKKVNELKERLINLMFESKKSSEEIKNGLYKECKEPSQIFKNDKNNFIGKTKLYFITKNGKVFELVKEDNLTEEDLNKKGIKILNKNKEEEQFVEEGNSKEEIDMNISIDSSLLDDNIIVKNLTESDLKST